MLTVFAALLMLTIPPSTRVLALGDSYTIGESVAVADRWPNQLQRALQQRGLYVADPEIIAKTGWTTDELSSAIDTAKPKGHYELVTLLIGVNNQYRGRDAEQYRKEFAQLLQRAIGYAGGNAKRVVVVSIPDWGVTPFGKRAGRGHEVEEISQPIDRFNAIAYERCRAAGVSWIDVTTATRAHPQDMTLLARDELHYSRSMHDIWAEQALPAARMALGLSLPATTQATSQPAASQ